MADNPPKPPPAKALCVGQVGVGGYLMDVPQALPVGLHFNHIIGDGEKNG